MLGNAWMIQTQADVRQNGCACVCSPFCSALRSGSTIHERWSATCSFDVGDQLHTFSAFTQHDSATAAQESLAQQLLQQDVCWRLVLACVLHELKGKRRATGSSLAGPPVLRLLLQDKAQLAELERGEHECAVRSARAIEAQVAGSSVLRLDALLSARGLPAMIYSAEQVGIQGSRSRRSVWSVAAQLPPPLLLNRGSPTGSGSTVAQAAAAIKEDKVSRIRIGHVGLDCGSSRDELLADSLCLSLSLLLLSLLFRWRPSLSAHRRCSTSSAESTRRCSRRAVALPVHCVPR